MVTVIDYLFLSSSIACVVFFSPSKVETHVKWMQYKSVNAVEGSIISIVKIVPEEPLLRKSRYFATLYKHCISNRVSDRIVSLVIAKKRKINFWVNRPRPTSSYFTAS